MVSGRVARVKAGWAGSKSGVADNIRTSAKIIKIAGNIIGNIMDMKDVIENLPVDESFTKQQFGSKVREINAGYSESAVF